MIDVKLSLKNLAVSHRITWFQQDGGNQVVGCCIVHLFILPSLWCTVLVSCVYSRRLRNVSQLTCTDDSRLIDSCGDRLYSALPNILAVLKRGYGERITGLIVSPVLREVVSSKSSLSNLMFLGQHFHTNFLTRNDFI